MKRTQITFLVLLLALLLSAASTRATIHTIDVGNFFFSPTNTTVNPGDTVRWIFVSGTHSSTTELDSPKSWDSGIKTSGTYDVVFTAGDGPGPFPYLCSVHPSSMKDTIFMATSSAEPTVFTFKLDQSQAGACAGTGSEAMGYGLAVLSPDSTQLSFKVYHSVSSPTSAHVHLGAPCVDGGVSFGFAGAASPITDTWSLSASDVTDLMAGDLYVNIHSGAFPGGEIRGQIVQEPLKFVFNLSEAQADGGTGTGSFAAGLAVCELDAMSAELSVSVTHDVSAVSDGHVHLGAPGVSGPIQFGFSDANSPISEAWAVDTLDIDNLIAGNLYVNVHSAAFPSGEIRGQIANTELNFGLLLDGSQANAGAGTGSSATGLSVMTLSPDHTKLTVHVEHDVTDAIDGHIHLGSAGVNGPVQFGFSGVTSPIDEEWAISASDLDNLLAGDLYVNIHSTPFPGGEIRGQIPFYSEMAYVVALEESEANACLGTSSSAIGEAQITLKPGGREMTINVTHDVSMASDGHIHLAPKCTNGPVQFGFPGVTSPINTIWYLSTGDVTNLLRDELYVNIHSPSFPAGEIRGQIGNFGCCVGITGNVDGDENEVVDIGDLTALINYLFIDFIPPTCPAEGNVNGDMNQVVDIGDLTSLINYLFITFEEPSSCL